MSYYKKSNMKRSCAVLLLLFVSILAFSEIRAEILPLMRISVENTGTHAHTKAVKRFAVDLREELKGKIDIQFYSNAKLFRDQDVIEALVRGNVEMAVPGTWHVSNFEPNIAVFMLPIFYGRDRQVNYEILDSDIGVTLNRLIEKNIGVKVLGRWIDLGHAHLFSVDKKISRHEDISGIKVRVAGGVANKLRIDMLNGKGTIIPWPDLPEYLDQQKIDAILTSYETVRSAKLWQHGVKYVFEDNEYFAQYAPLIRDSFWKKLPGSTRKTIIVTWEKYVDTARKEAAISQEIAKLEVMRHGVQVTVPKNEEIIFWRKKLVKSQEIFIHEMSLNRDLVKKTSDIFKIKQ
jgi:TRAP-type C4-dicarboxylate transport system substrate-binding protein